MTFTFVKVVSKKVPNEEPTPEMIKELHISPTVVAANKCNSQKNSLTKSWEMKEISILIMSFAMKKMQKATFKWILRMTH